MERWQRYGVPFPLKKKKWQATTPSNVSLRWARWRQMGHTKNSSQYLQSTKNITWPRWFYEAEMTIDLPCTNISFSQMKLVEQHDYDLIWFDLIYSSHAIWHKMPLSFNKSIKQQEAMHYSYYTTARCY